MPARRMRPNRLPPSPAMRQHSAHTPSLRSAAPRESSLERVRRIAREHEKPFDPSKRGTWRGSSRDLVVNPSKRFKQAHEGRVDRDSDTPEDEFLVIEEDRGNGTLEWVLVNPLDYPDGKHGSYDNLYAFGFGAYGSTRALLWGSSIEDALEEVAEWLAKYAPGHITSEEDVAKLMAEVREDEGDMEDDEAYEKATADLTYTEAGHLTSYEWTVDDVPRGSELYKAAYEASREEYQRENDDEAAEPNGRAYHVVVINERTGRRTRMTYSPVTHAEGVTILGKLRPHKDTRAILEPV